VSERDLDLDRLTELAPDGLTIRRLAVRRYNYCHLIRQLVVREPPKEKPRAADDS
jgi:hypothetical protein